MDQAQEGSVLAPQRAVGPGRVAERLRRVFEDLAAPAAGTRRRCVAPLRRAGALSRAVALIDLTWMPVERLFAMRAGSRQSGSRPRTEILAGAARAAARRDLVERITTNDPRYTTVRARNADPEAAPHLPNAPRGITRIRRVELQLRQRYTADGEGCVQVDGSMSAPDLDGLLGRLRRAFLLTMKCGLRIQSIADWKHWRNIRKQRRGRSDDRGKVRRRPRQGRGSIQPCEAA
jgi:hypothetical protein